MSVTFSGVFPVHAVDLEIDSSGRAATAVFVGIADLESAQLSIDTGVETWNPLDQGGWQRALATAKSFTISCSGKRNIGDSGNNYIASKIASVGTDCNSAIKITFPDGAIFQGNVVISLSECGTGDSTNVGPLVFDLISDGQPTYTPAT